MDTTKDTKTQTAGVRLAKNYFSRAFACLFVVSLASCLLVSILLLSGDHSRLEYSTQLHKTSFVGEYRGDGGAWLPLGESSRPDFTKYKIVELRGHFTNDIDKNVLFMLRIQYLKVSLRLNGREIYSFGAQGTTHRLSKSAGDVWAMLSSPGITRADEVEMTLSDVYGNRYLPVVEKLLREIYYGNGDALYRKVFMDRGASAFMALLIFVLGLVELAVALLLLRMGGRRLSPLFYNTGYSLFIAVWFFIQSDVSFLQPFYPFTTYMEIVSALGAAVFFSLYISAYLTGRRKKFVQAVAAALLSAIAALSLLQATGASEAYDWLNEVTLCSWLALPLSYACLILEYLRRGKRKVKAALATTALIPAGATLDAAVYIFTPGNYAIAMQLCTIASVLLLGGVMIREYKHRMDASARVERMENELTQGRMAIMISQIQPHFLYNALATIKALCGTDSEAAERAIDHFSKFLRQNMDALTSKTLIPFEQELRHIDNYIYIEKIRYDDRIHFVFDIQSTGFFLPALSVQPLVENAIRYSVRSATRRGTVAVSSREDAHGYYVTVADDGCGFDYMQTPRDDRNHVGIENVKSRLDIMCSGKLTIESSPLTGTEITIFIPKDDE